MHAVCPMDTITVIITTSMFLTLVTAVPIMEPAVPVAKAPVEPAVPVRLAPVAKAPVEPAVPVRLTPVAKAPVEPAVPVRLTLVEPLPVIKIKNS